MDLKRKREDIQTTEALKLGRLSSPVDGLLTGNVERKHNHTLEVDSQEDLFHLISTDESPHDPNIDAFQRLVNSNRRDVDTTPANDAEVNSGLFSATYSQLRSAAYAQLPSDEPSRSGTPVYNVPPANTHNTNSSTSTSTANITTSATYGTIHSDTTSQPPSIATTHVVSIPPCRPRATMYFDGGALGNPGRAGAGYLLYPDSVQPPHLNPSETFAKAAVRMHGICTNNQAEYMGLIHGLQAAIVHNVKHLTVYGDSELVIKQMKGIYKVKNPILQVLNVRAQSLARQLVSVAYNWVARSKNKPADALSNVAMYQPDQAEECADFDGK